MPKLILLGAGEVDPSELLEVNLRKRRSEKKTKILTLNPNLSTRANRRMIEVGCKSYMKVSVNLVAPDLRAHMKFLHKWRSISCSTVFGYHDWPN